MNTLGTSINRNVVVFDLDGTLALIGHRLHFIDDSICLMAGRPKDYDTFYAACVDDAPNLAVIATLHAHAAAGHETWIVSGRSDTVRTETITWIRRNIRHRLYESEILMRPADDHQPDDKLKRSWIVSGKLPRERILCVYEDRLRVVKMWRSEGIPCFQVCEGNY